MEKKGLTWLEVVIAIAIVGILAAIVVPTFMKPDITVYIEETNGKKTLIYQVYDRYHYERLYFRDIGLDGTLDSVKNPHGLISNPNTITVGLAPSLRIVSWNTWVDRFEQEIRPEAVGN